MDILRLESTSLPEEDLQDIFIQAFTKVQKKCLPKASSIEDLIKQFPTIIRNELNDFVRAENAQKRGSGRVRSLEEVPPEDIPATSSPTPAMQVEQKERARMLVEAINQLPESLRGVVHDHLNLELKEKEIADKRGLSIGSIGVNKARGLAALRPILKKMDFL